MSYLYEVSNTNKMYKIVETLKRKEKAAGHQMWIIADFLGDGAWTFHRIDKHSNILETTPRQMQRITSACRALGVTYSDQE